MRRSGSSRTHWRTRTVSFVTPKVRRHDSRHCSPSIRRHPRVTRDRLYIDALEEVYGNSNKVLLDSKGSGNLLYLPIDKLIQGRSSVPAGQDASRTEEQSRAGGYQSPESASDRRTEDTTMSNAVFRLFVVLGLLVVAAGLSLFTVNERELAIKLQLGKVVQSDYEPGLQWKIPLVQNVHKFPRRILTIEDSPDRGFYGGEKSGESRLLRQMARY